MKKIISLAGLLVWCLTLLVGCGGGGGSTSYNSSNSLGGGGSVAAGDAKVGTLTLVARFPGGELEALGARAGDPLAYGLMTVTVLDEDGVPIVGQEVELITSQGDFVTNSGTSPLARAAGVNFSVPTGDGGAANFFLVAPSTLGTAQIYAVASGVFSDPVVVTFIRGPVSNIDANFTTNAIAPGDSADIVAFATDGNGIPVPGQLLTFSVVTTAYNAAAGTVGPLLAPIGTTDTNGLARVTYTAGTVSGDTFEVVESSFGTYNSIASIDVSTAATFLSKFSITDVTRETMRVDNTNKTFSTITVTLEDNAGDPPIATPVTFSTSLGRLGDIAGTVYNATTLIYNSNALSGTASVRLYTDDVPGIATVSAVQGGYYDEKEVEFLAGKPNNLDARAVPDTIGPNASTTITVEVVDQFDNPVADETVLFTYNSVESGIPTVQETAVTGASGQVTVSYTVGATGGAAAVYNGAVLVTPAEIIDIIDIKASSNPQVAYNSAAINVVTGTGDISFIELATGIDAIVADYRTVLLTATVLDVDSNPYPNPTVSFSTTLGKITAVAAASYNATTYNSLSDSINITVTGDTNVAKAFLVSGPSAGTATVDASVTGLYDVGTVTFFAGSPSIINLVRLPSGQVAPLSDVQIAATVTDSNGNPVVLEQLNFSISDDKSEGAALGVVSVNTNPNGQAFVTYTAGTKGGTAATPKVDTITVRAESNALYNTQTVDVVSDVANVVQNVVLEVGATDHVVGGSTPLSIKATVTNIDGELVSDTPVTFTTFAGVLYNSSSLTGAPGTTSATKRTVDGVSEVYLKSPDLIGTTVATANAGGIIDSQVVTFIAGAADSVSFIASPDSVGTGGQTTLIATVTDAGGNPVAGETVQYGYNSVATNASGGTLDLLSGLTDDNGRAEVLFSAGTGGASISDTITATTTNGETDSADVAVTQDTANIVSLTLSSASDTIDVEDSSTTDFTTIQATVIGTLGPLAAQQVFFSTSEGAFSDGGTDATYNSLTSSNGIATATLYAGTRPARAHVSALTGGFGDNVTVTFQAGPAELNNSVITANPSTIPADGFSTTTITVFLADSNGNPVVDGTVVNLYTDASGAGAVIQDLDAPTISGRAEFTVQAPAAQTTATFYTTVVAGLTGDVTFGAQPPGDPANILLDVTETHLFVAGVGQAENTTITVTVADAEGNPIDESLYNSTITNALAGGGAPVAADADKVNNLRVSFISSPNGGEYVAGTNGDGTPVTILTGETTDIRTHNGIATLNLQSGTLPGVIEIKFEALLEVDGTYNSASTITSALPQVSIDSGPPHTVALTWPNKDAIENLGSGKYRQTGAAFVTDRFGNAVPDGTTINLGMVDSLISYGNASADVTVNSATLVESFGGNIADDSVVRGTTRYVEVNDRVLLPYAPAQDKSRFVAVEPILDSVVVQTNYDETGTYDYVIGASLLGSYVSGYNSTTGSLTFGQAQTKDGIADFRVTFPANSDTILTGCYGYGSATPGPDDYSSVDIRYNDPLSAQTYLIASTSDNSATTIDNRGNFCFGAIAPAFIAALPTKLDGSGTVSLWVTDDAASGDGIYLPYVGVNAFVAVTTRGTYDECDGAPQFTDEATCTTTATCSVGSCSALGVCSDPAYTNEVMCDNGDLLDDLTDNDTVVWIPFGNQAACEGNGETWTNPTDPAECIALGGTISHFWQTDIPSDFGITATSGSTGTNGYYTSTVTLSGTNPVPGDSAIITYTTLDNASVEVTVTIPE